MALIPSIKKDDWTGLNRIIRKLASLKLGPNSSPTFSGFTIIDSDGDIVAYMDEDIFYIVGIAAPAAPVTGNPIGLLLTLTYTV